MRLPSQRSFARPLSLLSARPEGLPPLSAGQITDFRPRVRNKALARFGMTFPNLSIGARTWRAGASFDTQRGLLIA